MAELRALTPEQFARAEARLRNPTLGGRIEAAKKFGIDVTLLIEQLRLKPAERVERMLQLAQIAECARGAARRRG